MNTTPFAYNSKRALDICLALGLAIPAAMVAAICAIAVAIEARANPLFIQTRVGFGKQSFKIVKLRTMPPQTRNAPSHEIDAKAILKVGKIIRATKLDELPQIWNVLCGDMSFVGPRPCLPAQKELIAERAQRGIYNLRPGITGPAQLAGIDMSTPRKLAEADAVYLKQQSLLGDLKILLRTFTGSGSGDAATKRSR
ncbi:sugar transferase [Qipengyuania flava]|jgi:O-antigen biosynthesis protein WbqP|uniref:sugar transferase n=1 Tax=Qipengyuania flava TaxID=192812 RepID=UPI001C59B926|nr:sugar transferase [Qipengyuania flava]MBW3168688.1 sugar transferase [Qipengyuania flava]MBY5965926.1 sugar transferase [Qipengyuania flava]MBY6012250.1 sugar transferase [Qipengyuania flava]MBY6026692.1 sugar transferase [Qipengyuania flava]